MGQPRRREASYADLERLPEHLVGEIVDGELYASPRPASPHARTAGGIHIALGGPFDHGPGGPGGWWFLVEPELHIGRNVLVPDLAAWRRERMPEIPEVAAFDLAPDWVCEVVSPSTARLDRGKKVRVYARAGVAHLWLVEPSARTVENFRLERGHWTLVDTYDGDMRARIEPFDAIELDLAGWWLPSTARATKPATTRRPGPRKKSR